MTLGELKEEIDSYLKRGVDKNTLITFQEAFMSYNIQIYCYQINGKDKIIIEAREELL